MPTWPRGYELSRADPTVTPSMAAVIAASANVRARVCQRPVPRAATVPLANVLVEPDVVLFTIDQPPLLVARRKYPDCRLCGRLCSPARPRISTVPACWSRTSELT